MLRWALQKVWLLQTHFYGTWRKRPPCENYHYLSQMCNPHLRFIIFLTFWSFVQYSKFLRHLSLTRKKLGLWFHFTFKWFGPSCPDFIFILFNKEVLHAFIHSLAHKLKYSVTIFWPEIFTRKVALWSFLWAKWVKKIHKSTFQVKKCRKCKRNQVI